jgi:hypothetical protein
VYDKLPHLNSLQENKAEQIPLKNQVCKAPSMRFKQLTISITTSGVCSRSHAIQFERGKTDGQLALFY